MGLGCPLVVLLLQCRSILFPSGERSLTFLAAIPHKAPASHPRKRSVGLFLFFLKNITLVPFKNGKSLNKIFLNKTAGEKARRQLHKNVASNIEQVLAATPHKAPTIRPHTSHHENYPSETNQTCRTLLEK